MAIKQLTITKDDDAADLIQKFQEFGSEAVVMRCDTGDIFKLILYSRLSHHNLVRFFGITMRPKWQILMEFIAHGMASPSMLFLNSFAGDLYRHLHKTISSISEFPVNLRLRVALDVATGMRYLHSQGLVHRDLRSPNVFMVALDHTAPIVAKVADFGTEMLPHSPSCVPNRSSPVRCWISVRFTTQLAVAAARDMGNFGFLQRES